MQVDGFVLQPLVEPCLRTADSGQFLAELVNWQGGAHCMTGPILVEQLTAGAVAQLSALAGHQRVHESHFDVAPEIW